MSEKPSKITAEEVREKSRDFGTRTKALEHGAGTIEEYLKIRSEWIEFLKNLPSNNLRTKARSAYWETRDVS